MDLSDLPDETLRGIFYQTGPAHVFKLAALNRRFRQIVLSLVSSTNDPCQALAYMVEAIECCYIEGFNAARHAGADLSVLLNHLPPTSQSTSKSIQDPDLWSTRNKRVLKSLERVCYTRSDAFLAFITRCAFDNISDEMHVDLHKLMVTAALDGGNETALRILIEGHEHGITWSFNRSYYKYMMKLALKKGSMDMALFIFKIAMQQHPHEGEYLSSILPFCRETIAFEVIRKAAAARGQNCSSF